MLYNTVRNILAIVMIIFLFSRQFCALSNAKGMDIIMTRSDYALDTFWKLTKIPVRYFDIEHHIVRSYGFDTDNDPVVCNAALQVELIGLVEMYNAAVAKPVLYYEDVIFLYGVFCDHWQNTIILGPVNIDNTESFKIRQYVHKNGPSIQTYLQYKTPEEFCVALAFLNYALTGEMIQEQNILFSAKTPNQLKDFFEYQNYVLSNADQEIRRLSYEFEQKLMSYISEGNPDAIIEHKSDDYITRIGKFAKSTFKQYEYMACSSITLATRAAINGGITPLTAYAISDLAKQNLEQCKTISEIMALQRKTRIKFATLVKEIKNNNQKQSSYIEKCRVYIVNHLNKPFTLEDIAEEVGINKSYLSRRFSEEMGMGIQKYTQIERINAASNMLKYSNETIPHIANYLCFPSQSHFGKVFKEHMGITPKQYRNREKPIDFTEKFK